MFNFIRSISNRIGKDFDYDLLYQVKQYESIKYKMKYLKNFKNWIN